MEIIRKKICLEEFKSRIPALIETIEVDGVEEPSTDGSWGKFPKSISILGKEIRYRTLMDLYHSLLKIVMGAFVLEYDKPGKKWIELDYDWRDILNEYYSREVPFKFVTEIPTEDLTDGMMISLVSSEDETLFYDKVQEIFEGTNDGFNVILELHRTIGKKVTPSRFNGMYVPYYFYLADVPDMISFLETLQNTEVCCDKKRFDEYGGEDFLTYLKELSIPEQPELGGELFNTIDIPILLTSDLLDLGQYKMYNVEEIIEGEEDDTEASIETEYCKYCSLPIDGIHNHTKCSSKMVKTSGESKLRTLRKRKRSMDDDGNELPGIYTIVYEEDGITIKEKIIESPYQPEYVKNIQIKDGVFYGDLIVTKTEIFTPNETNELLYESLKERVIVAMEGAETPGFKESSGVAPIEGLTDNLSNPGIITYGNINKTEDQIDRFFDMDFDMRRKNLVTGLSNLLNSEYGEYYCYKQDYEFSYELTYGEGDDNGDLISKVKSITETGTIHLIADDIKNVFVYALGAKLKQNGEMLEIDEESPFDLNEAQQDSWNGAGIWYQETIPLKKMCVSDFVIDDEENTFVYDIIDFESQEFTYSYDGIDFPRKKYILCNDIRYKSESHHNYSTMNPVFRDEKMMGLNLPMKEHYDVVIDRGSSAAFERHLQLSELKTWQDLENYRNGMFLNK